MFYYIFILASASVFGVGDDLNDVFKKDREYINKHFFGEDDSDLDSSNEAISEEDASQEDEGGMNAEQFIAFISKTMHEKDKTLLFIGGEYEGEANEVAILHYALIAACANVMFGNDAFFVRNGLTKPTHLRSLNSTSGQDKHIDQKHPRMIEDILGIKVAHKWTLHLNSIKDILRNFLLELGSGTNTVFYVDDKVAFQRIMNEKDIKAFLKVEFKLRKNAHEKMGVTNSESINEEMSEGDADSESSDEAGMDAKKFIAFISEEMHTENKNLFFIGNTSMQNEQDILYFVLSLVYSDISLYKALNLKSQNLEQFGISVPTGISMMQGKMHEDCKISKGHLDSIKTILSIELARDNKSTHFNYLKSIFEKFCRQIEHNRNKRFFVDEPSVFKQMMVQKNYKLLKKVEFKLKNEAVLKEDKAVMDSWQFIDFISTKMHEKDENLLFIGGKDGVEENELNILHYVLIAAYTQASNRNNKFYATISLEKPKYLGSLVCCTKQKGYIEVKHATMIKAILGIKGEKQSEVHLNHINNILKNFLLELASGTNTIFYVDDKVEFKRMMTQKNIRAFQEVKFKLKENANEKIEENLNQAMAVEVYGDGNSENEPNSEEGSPHTNQSLIDGIDIDDLIHLIYTDDVNANEVKAVEVNDGSGTESDNDLTDKILRDDHHKPQQYIPFLPGADQEEASEEEDSEKKRSSKNSCSAEQLRQLQKEWGDDDDAEMGDESSESNETPSATANGSSSQETNGRNGSSKNHSNTRKKSAPVADWPCQAAAEYDEALVIRLLNLGEVTEDVDLQEVIEFDPLWTPEGSTDQRVVAFLRLVYQRTGNRQNLNHFFDFYALTLRYPDLWEQVVAGENRMPETDLRADIHLLEESALNAVVDLNKQTENANNNAVALYVAMQALHVLNYHQFIHMWFANFIPVLFRMAQQLEPHRRSVAMY